MKEADGFKGTDKAVSQQLQNRPIWGLINLT